MEGKNIVIVGGNSGIGKATAELLKAQGANLYLYSKSGVGTTGLDTSSDFEEMPGLPEVIDGVVYAPGTINLKPFHRISVDDFKKEMEVNFFGNIALAKAVLPIFRTQKAGQFLVVSSIAGKFGFHLRSAYSASKHALFGYFESLVMEESDYNLKVTVACPGKINTPISTNAVTGEGKAHGQMDHNQATGMPVDVCVQQLLNALVKNKHEVLIGNKELMAVHLKRFFPRLFWKIIPKQSAT